jgi:NAD(P)-dependent dehydrogenase (short-subunit alcohol dehydrogenase family)
VKRALVVGASQSLGAHVAALLATTGWSVRGTGRRPADQVPGVDAFEYVHLDLADVADVDRFLADADGAGYDLVVHNAVRYGGVYGTAMPEFDELETAFRVNTLAPYRLLHGLLEAQPADRFCSCVVVNSDAIFHATRHTACYAATKAALRVLTTALADMFRAANVSVATLLLGPLPDPRKLADLEQVARRRGVGIDEVTRLFLRRSNPSYVIEELIDFETCFRSIECLAGLGRSANGMMCRLDGGSAGSLV